MADPLPKTPAAPRVTRARRIANSARAAGASVARRLAPERTYVAQRFAPAADAPVRRAGAYARRAYTVARGGVGRLRGVARNARQRASSVLAGGSKYGKIIAMVVTAAIMVALIPLLRKWLKLDGKPNADLWLGAIFLAVALFLWGYVNRPQWALAAAGVAGFLAGSSILTRLFQPPAQMAAQGANVQSVQPAQAQRQIPDRAASANAPINIAGNRSAIPVG